MRRVVVLRRYGPRRDRVGFAAHDARISIFPRAVSPTGDPSVGSESQQLHASAIGRCYRSVYAH